MWKILTDGYIVHRRGQDTNARRRLQGARISRRKLQEGHQVAGYPVSAYLSPSDKKQIVGELQKASGGQDKTLSNFLSTLAENNRLGLLHGIVDQFAVLMSAARGEVEMTITSASPLDQKVVKQLETAVSKSQYVGQGKKLKVVPKVS